MLIDATTPMRIEHCVLAFIALGALAPDLGRAAPPAADGAMSQPHLISKGAAPVKQFAARASQSQKLATSQQQIHAASSKPPLTMGQAERRASGAGPLPVHATQLQHALAPHLMSDNAPGRHASSSPAIGGPAKYDARNGAVINGAEMKRRF